MIIGVPKELKEDEARVAMMPSGVEALMSDGQHTVLIEAGAGEGSGISDSQYEEQGAHIVASADEIWMRSDLVVKVKEPLDGELDHLHAGQILFTYLHLSRDLDVTKRVLDSEIIAIAYETVTDRFGGLPLLRPMSEIAGSMSIQQGAKYLERPFGGCGKLLSGATGVPPAKVVIIGGGTVGTAAAKRAAGFGANVILLEVDQNRLYRLASEMPANVTTVASSRTAIREGLREADLVIGAVLVPGAHAPIVVSQQDLKLMTPRGVIVDVAIDQGGCVETSELTTHTKPIRIVDDILHYAVPNIPGAVPQTSTRALTTATLPFILDIASKGIQRAVVADRHLAAGVNAWCGTLTNAAVAKEFVLDYGELISLLSRSTVAVEC